MKVWITKYALTAGIFSVDATLINTSPGMVLYTLVEPDHREYAYGDEWHATPESALERAEAMRKAKIASLEKQLAKHRAMTFTAEA